jgi:ubiquitin carboxyl-terminal hydrolase 4/11/15
MQTYFILLSLFGGNRLIGWFSLNVITQYVITLDKNELLFYLFPCRWWQHWIEYVNQDQTNPSYDGSSFHEHSDLARSSALKRPADIDNYDLIDNTGPDDSSTGIEIHDTLLEGRDYVLLPQEVWDQLFKW